MYAKHDYDDQLIEIDIMDVNLLTKDQIFYLLEFYKDESMSLNQASVPTPHHCRKISNLEALLTDKEKNRFKKYYHKKIGI